MLNNNHAKHPRQFNYRLSRPQKPRGDLFCFSPGADERGLDLGFETGDEFAVGVDQRLLGLDLRHRLSGMARQATFYFRGLTLREEYVA